MRLLLLPAPACYTRPHAPDERALMCLLLLHAYARHAVAHVCGDHLRLRSLSVPANETTYNMKHLLQYTSETYKTFRNIHLQHMCLATATYATSRQRRP
jgi:hypothetical protein